MSTVLKQIYDLIEFFEPVAEDRRLCLHDPTEVAADDLVRTCIRMQRRKEPVSVQFGTRRIALPVLTPAEQNAMIRYAHGERPTYSSNIADFLTCGYGKLDDFGEWEFPLPALFVRWLEGTYFNKDKNHDQQSAATAEQPN